MKLKKIILHNFRAYRHEEIELNDNFACIIGKNDTGKSTILTALEWFFNRKELNEYDINVDLPKDSFAYDCNALYVEITLVDIFFQDSDDYSFKSDTDFLKKIELSILKNYKSDYTIKLYCQGETDYFEDSRKFYQIDDMFQQFYGYYCKKDCTRIFRSKFADFEFYSLINNKLRIPIFRIFTPICPLKEYLNILFKVNFVDANFDRNIADIKSKISSDINIKLSNSKSSDECYFNSITANIDFFPNDKDLMFDVDNSLLKNIPIDNRGDGFQWEIKNIVCRLIAERISDGNDYYYIFAFEEPETHLHPSAQIEMYKTIKMLSKNANYQVLMTTHSPYIVKELAKDNKPIVIKRDDQNNKSYKSEFDEQVLAHDDYVSMNEINYFAFEEPTVEYHQELFAFLQGGEKTVDGVDAMFEQKYDWFQIDNKGKLVMVDGSPIERKHSLPYCVRNQIDHPNDKNKIYADREIRKASIDIMREAILKMKETLS